MQLGSQLSVNFGSSIAGLIIPVVGSAAVVSGRQLVTMIVLLPVTRPRMRGRSFTELWPALALGVALAGMNLAFYEAVGRIGVGPAVTIEFLGPLAIALATSRRFLDVLCAIGAGVGVYLLVGPEGDFDPFGVLMGLTAGVGWAAYILLTRRVAQQFRGLEGLAIASLVALVLTLPIGALTIDYRALDWGVIWLLVVVGVLCSALPYSLDNLILRRITPRLYSIITALAPVLATFAGWIVLGQSLTQLQLLAVGIVCVSAGTAITTQRDKPSSPLEEAASDIP